MNHDNMAAEDMLREAGTIFTSPTSPEPEPPEYSDDAVALAVEQNLGIQVERLNPQIQDIAIAQTRASWAPTLTSNITNSSTATPAK